MENYFRTLDATCRIHHLNVIAQGRKIVDRGALKKAMKSELRRHHGIVGEANFIINTYNDKT